MIAGTFAARRPPSVALFFGATCGYSTGQLLRRNSASRMAMLCIAFQPRSPQEVGNSLMDSQNGFGVVPMVRYCTSMISSAGRLPMPEGRPKPAAL